MRQADSRGVTALQGHDQGEAPLELIFWQLMCDMNFDPAAEGPDIEEPEQWDLDDEYPRSLIEMMLMLGGGDGGGVGSGSVADADRGHDRVSGSESRGTGASCADAPRDPDIGAVAGVFGGGSAGSATLRDDQFGAVDGEVEVDGVGVETQTAGTQLVTEVSIE